MENPAPQNGFSPENFGRKYCPKIVEAKQQLKTTPDDAVGTSKRCEVLGQNENASTSLAALRGASGNDTQKEKAFSRQKLDNQFSVVQAIDATSKIQQLTSSSTAMGGIVSNVFNGLGVFNRLGK
jgi:hypothetical protein